MSWRAVVGWQDLYVISAAGEVRSLDRQVPCRAGVRIVPGRLLRPALDRNGYLVVSLKHGSRRAARFVHQLVLEAFVGSRRQGEQVRHLNGDRADNRLDNLAWGSASENAADRIAHGTQARGERHGVARLDTGRVDLIRRAAAEGESQAHIARRLGIGRSTVQAILSGRTWAHVRSAK